MSAQSLPVKGIVFYGEWKMRKQPRILGRHKNVGLEIVLISKGKLHWEIEGRATDLQANMLFFTLPWQEHGGVEALQPSCEISYLCIRLDRNYTEPQRNFRLHPAFGFSREEDRLIAAALGRARIQAFPADGEAVRLFGSFFRLTREAGLLGQSRARDTVKLIVAHLAGLAAKGAKGHFHLDEAERRAREFVGSLASRCEEPWTLESMSAACRLGRTQFSSLLKKYTGDTPMTCLNRIRLRKAQQLLLESDRSVTEIAHTVGFNSSQYFATVFKEFTGMEPRRFREMRANFQD